MNEIEKLLKKQRKLKARMQKLLNGATDGKLNEDDTNLYEKYDRQFDEASEQIKRLEKLEQREKELDELDREPLVGGKDPSLGLKDEEVKRYSLMKAVRAIATGDYSDAEYERELSNQIADKIGVEPRGMYIPTEVQRAVLSTGNTGALVPTEHRADMYIESLKEESFVLSMGAKLLTDLVGNVDIPKSAGGMNFSFVSEDDDSPDSDASFETVSLTPHTASGSIAITRLLMKQSSPEVEKLIEDDIRTGMALMIDEAVIAGDGQGANPTGILYATGTNAITVADADGVPTFEETVEFETKVAEAKALRGGLNYVTTPAINGKWKTTRVDAGSGIMVNVNNTVNGYPSRGSSLVPTGKTIFGNFEDVIIGQWGVLDLVVDTATRAAKGGTVLRAWMELDVAIRHPQSFSITGE